MLHSGTLGWQLAAAPGPPGCGSVPLRGHTGHLWAALPTQASVGDSNDLGRGSRTPSLGKQGKTPKVTRPRTAQNLKELCSCQATATAHCASATAWPALSRGLFIRGKQGAASNCRKLLQMHLLTAGRQEGAAPEGPSEPPTPALQGWQPQPPRPPVCAEKRQWHPGEQETPGVSRPWSPVGREAGRDVWPATPRWPAAIRGRSSWEPDGSAAGTDTWTWAALPEGPRGSATCDRLAVARRLMQPPDEARRDMAEEAHWSRPECQVWTGTLLLGTCLLYCARCSLPICAAAMSQDFGWNKKEVGLALSSFFCGYCFTQVLGGHLGDRFGGEKVIVLSASAWGCLTAATPLLTSLGSTHLLFLTCSRALTGLLQGVHFPALSSLLAQKVRESERASAYSTVGSGTQCGTLVTGAVGSLLLDCCGWQSVFYFSGGLTVLWAGCVYRHLLNGADHSLAPGLLLRGPPSARSAQVPWRLLFRRPSVWAVVFSQLSSACSCFTLLSWLPTFFQETFPHTQGWIFNVVPWLVAIPTGLLGGLLADHLISQGYRTITVRKLMQVLGLGLSSVCGLGVGHSRSFLSSVAFATASIGLQTFNHSGISVNVQDLAPSCAGFLFGVANTAGALAGVLGVYVSGHLIESTGSWASLFHLGAAVNALGLCSFLAFGQAHRIDLGPSWQDL